MRTWFVGNLNWTNFIAFGFIRGEAFLQDLRVTHSQRCGQLAQGRENSIIPGWTEPKQSLV